MEECEKSINKASEEPPKDYVAPEPKLTFFQRVKRWLSSYEN